MTPMMSVASDNAVFSASSTTLSSVSAPPSGARSSLVMSRSVVSYALVPMQAAANREEDLIAAIDMVAAQFINIHTLAFTDHAAPVTTMAAVTTTAGMRTCASDKFTHSASRHIYIYTGLPSLFVFFCFFSHF